MWFLQFRTPVSARRRAGRAAVCRGEGGGREVGVGIVGTTSPMSGGRVCASARRGAAARRQALCGCGVYRTATRLGGCWEDRAGGALRGASETKWRRALAVQNGGGREEGRRTAPASGGGTVEGRGSRAGRGSAWRGPPCGGAHARCRRRGSVDGAERPLSGGRTRAGIAPRCSRGSERVWRQRAEPGASVRALGDVRWNC